MIHLRTVRNSDVVIRLMDVEMICSGFHNYDRIEVEEAVCAMYVEGLYKGGLRVMLEDGAYLVAEMRVQWDQGWEFRDDIMFDIEDSILLKYLGCNVVFHSQHIELCWLLRCSVPQRIDGPRHTRNPEPPTKDRMLRRSISTIAAYSKASRKIILQDGRRSSLLRYIEHSRWI